MSSLYRAHAVNEAAQLRNTSHELFHCEMCKQLQELSIRNNLFQFLIAVKGAVNKWERWICSVRRVKYRCARWLVQHLHAAVQTADCKFPHFFHCWHNWMVTSKMVKHSHCVLRWQWNIDRSRTSDICAEYICTILPPLTFVVWMAYTARHLPQASLRYKAPFP